MYCHLDFKIRYLKNLRLFSIRVTKLFEPKVLQKKKRKKSDGFSLFLKAFFLRYQPLRKTR